MTTQTTPTLVLSPTLDVARRLKQIQAWHKNWERENRLLTKRIAQLDLTKALERQRGAHLVQLQKRLEMNLVQVPLEISPDVVRVTGYDDLRRSLAQQFAALSKAERSLWLQNFLFIMTPALRQLNDKLAKIRGYRALGQKRNFLLGGPSGMGKSTYLDWFVMHHLPTIQPERNLVPVIKIDAPVNNRTPKPIYQRMILECGLTYTRSDDEEELLMKLALFFQQCGTELLIVDEVEHLKRPDLRRRLLEVSNLTRGMPIVCASCHPVQWVQGDPEIAGRWNDDFELEPYTGERLRQLLAFLELLLPFTQPSYLAYYELPLGGKSRQTIEGPARLIERWTGGILRDIMILILDASRCAIEQDLPQLSPTLLEATWRNIQTHPVTSFRPTAVLE